MKFKSRKMRADEFKENDWIKLGNIHYCVVAIQRTLNTTVLWFYADSSTQLMNPVMLSLPSDEIITVYNLKQ